MDAFRTRVLSTLRVLYMFTVKHAGPGLICSVAYL
jgi:hypothetical protein